MASSIEQEVIGERVVFPGDEMGIFWDGDSFFGQQSADFWVVKSIGCEARIDIARVAAAGTAIEQGVGIIRAMAAVAAEQDNAGEVFRKAHPAQSTLREGGALRSREIRDLGSRSCTAVGLLAGADELRAEGEAK